MLSNLDVSLRTGVTDYFNKLEGGQKMAVNASESIQTTRDLAHLEKNSTDLAGNRPAYHDFDDFEKSIHNSFSMLMEYRDAPRSPSTSSVTSVSASGLDALSSPTTPASPIQEDMDDEKLPNELLEEICEDMGIKDSMDIDLIDYMMDQTNQMNNMQGNENYYNSEQSYQVPRMPEIPLNMKGSGIPGGSMSMGKENMQRMMNPNFQSVNSGNSLSCMPGKMMHPGKPSNSFMGKNADSPSHAQSNMGFKAPCAPTQLASSVPSNINKPSNYHQMPSNQQQNIHGNCMHSYSLMSPMTRSCCGGTHHHYPNCSRSSECSGMTQRTVTFAGYPPNVPNHNLTPDKYLDNRTMDSGHNMGGKLDMYLPHNTGYTEQPQNKYGRPSPPVVNVQNMHMKMSNNSHFNNSAKLSQSGCLHQNMRPMTNCATRMFKYDEQQLASVQKGNNGRTLESPLDQGYFSGDAASVKSFSSQSSICQNSDMLSSQDSLAIKNEQSPQALYNRSDVASNQVTVKTENIMPSGRLNQNSGELISRVKQYTSSQPSNVACNQSFTSCQAQNNTQTNMPQYGFNINAACASDASQKSVQSKILPRLTHSKDVAPYTVPSNNGQATINPYHEFTQGATTAAQTGLDNTATAVDFPTNFGKESLNAEQQNQCQGINMYSPEYCKPVNTDCLMGNSDPHSHPSNLHAQQSPNLSYNNYSSHNSAIGQTLPHPVGHPGSAYPGMCIQKGMNNSYHYQNNSDAGTCSVMPNQMTSSIKSYKPNIDNQTYNVNKQQYMRESCLMSRSNMMTAQTWPHQEEYSSVNLNKAANLSQQQQNAHYMCPRNSIRQSSTSQCIQTSVQSPSLPPLSNPMPHNIEMRNQGMVDLPSNQMPSNPHPNILNDNMSQMNSQRNCWSTSMANAGNGNQVSQAINSMQTVQLPPQAKIPKAGLQHMQFPPHPIGENVSSNCKLSHRPPMLSSQEAFIEHLIMDKSSAYRSHPLFPLLRDLMITYMNFNSQSIHYQLIQHLPSQFERLLQNFLNRNPPRGDYQSNYAVESVIMDALRYAHSSLIEKIRSKQEQDKRIKGASQSITAIEEFCEKFDRSKHGNTLETGACIHGNPTSGGQPCGNQVFCRNTFLNDPNKNRLPMEVLKEQPDSISDTGSVVSSSSNHSAKSESKKHPSLPKEAVAIMLEWLRNHKDNPYPNDDEKAMLIKQTGLTINQINYWFTNARRRILPKWAQAQAQPQSSGSTSSQTPIQLPGHQVQLQHAPSQMQQQQQQQNSQSSSVTLTTPSSSTSVSTAVTNSTLNSTSCSSNSSSVSNDDNNSNNCQKSHLSSQQTQQTKASVQSPSCLANTQLSKSTPPPDRKSPEELVSEEDRPSTVSGPPLSE